MSQNQLFSFLFRSDQESFIQEEVPIGNVSY